MRPHKVPDKFQWWPGCNAEDFQNLFINSIDYIAYLCVCCIKYQALKVQEQARAEIPFHAFFTTTLDGNECLTSRRGALAP